MSVDIETRTRFGVIGEYRTLFDRNSDFKLESSYFNENWRTNYDIADPTIADPHIPKNRWNLFGSHRYTTASDWLTYSDTAAYSDDLFTRELMGRLDLSIRQEGNIRRSRYGESRMGLFKNWGDTFLKGEFNFYQDFIQPDKHHVFAHPGDWFLGPTVLPGISVGAALVGGWRKLSSARPR